MLSELILSIRSYSAVLTSDLRKTISRRTDTPEVCIFKSFRTEKISLFYFSSPQKIGTILTHVVLTLMLTVYIYTDQTISSVGHYRRISSR
ncbi:hypothetical protein P389DRAFT_48947 [Cystobasidium minutum MCA 4210]|uniref:uncharacterized protein n=1 Tax=Cystobasidium minutum MCA 4210 TaxID=1397322 RepID=UPI0034CDAD6D|eukprot:jgi/Rhomi1/48947/CE48946_535